MHNYKTEKIGLIPVLLLTWIVLIYYSQMLPSNHSIFESLIGSSVLFGGFVFLIKQGYKNISKSSFLSVVYFLLLISVLTLTSFFAIDPLRSFIRVIFSTVMYFLTFIIFVEVGKHYIANKSWRFYLAKTFLITLIIILIGQLLIPEWRMGVGGVRLTGGTNPNNVSFLAFFIVFISHFNSLVNGKWEKIDQLNWILANIVVLWAMSRSTYLGYLVFYFIYLGWFFVKNYIGPLLNGIILKKFVKRTLIFIMFIPIGLLLVGLFQRTEYYNYIILRLTGKSGFTSRSLAWDVLMEYFYQQPFFGGVGWWNASHVLPDVEGMAGSAHNLYVRLLSEVGIIGTTIILFLPIFISVGLIIKACSQNSINREKSMILVSSFLVGSFGLQFFEDKFLVGIFSLGNNIIILSLALGFVLLNSKHLLKK